MNETNHNDNVLSLHGRLTLDNVATTWRESRVLLHDQVRVVDLSDVEAVDSAGLALLLEWQAAAVAADRRLRFESAPDDLLRLAQLSEATELLGLNGRNTDGANDAP